VASTRLASRGIDIRDLNDRQRAFVFEYTKDYDATRAAKAAGYKGKNAGQKLLSSRNVERAIGAIQNRNLKKATMDREQILEELTNVATRDFLDLCDENGKFVIDDFRKVPQPVRRLIESVKIKERRTPGKHGDSVETEYEITLSNKLQAIDKLMRHFGMFAPQEHNVNVTAKTWDELFEQVGSPEDDLKVIEGKVKGKESQ